jgi:hypothetical protein
MADEIDKDLQDYLNEFDNVTGFDSEICPKCGLDFGKDEIKVASWIVLKDDLLFDDLESIGDIMEQHNIHYFFNKTENLKSDSKKYTLKVLSDKVDIAKSILNF